MRTDLISSKRVAGLAQTILQALNPSYAEYCPAASIRQRGTLIYRITIIHQPHYGREKFVTAWLLC
jgi:hypothetical protein